MVVEASGIDLTIKRIRANLSQWQVATELGRSSGWLSRLERGRNPLTADVADQISKAIDRVKEAEYDG